MNVERPRGEEVLGLGCGCLRDESPNLLEMVSWTKGIDPEPTAVQPGGGCQVLPGGLRGCSQLLSMLSHYS